jgi:superfamily II DNA or RNA helicase
MQTVHATVNGQIVLHELDAALVSKLRDTLSFPNPEYQTAIQFGEEPSDAVPPRLCCVTEHADGSITVPRGTVYELKACLELRGKKIRFADDRDLGALLLCRQQFAKPLRDYQIEAVNSVCEQLQGTIVFPCGAGKTSTAIGVIAKLQRSTLVLVQTIDLVKQWCGAIKELLDIDAAVFGAGKHELGAVTVATIQSLVRKPKVDLSGFGICILDEAHGAPARTVQTILARCPARWRIGLTATPKRSDGLTRMIEWSFGDRLIEKTVPELVNAGWLTLPTVEVVHTDFKFDCPGEWTRSNQLLFCRRAIGHRGDCSENVPDRVRINSLRKAVAEDRARNQLLANVIARESKGNTSLVLSNDKAHCELLRGLLEKRGVTAVVITSDVSKKNRNIMLSGLRDGSVPLAIATSLADQGLDIPRLSRVFLALPERSQGRTQQRAGRLMRPFDQPAQLFDFVDHQVGSLMSRWNSRQTVYRKLKLKVRPCQNNYESM